MVSMVDNIRQTRRKTRHAPQAGMLLLRLSGRYVVQLSEWRTARLSAASAGNCREPVASCLAKTRLARRGFTAAAAAVPIPFDAMASCRITMHRCHKP